jgi:predicted phage tail protein
MTNSNERDFKKVLETLDANEKATNGTIAQLIDEVFVPQALAVKSLGESLAALTKGLEGTHQGTYSLFADTAKLIAKLDARIQVLEEKVAQLEK